MTRMVASLSALLLSVVFLISGNAFLMTLLGIRLSIEQVTPDIIGWILVCYSVGFTLGTVFAERVVERVGHIRAFAVFAAALAVTIQIYPLAVAWWASDRLRLSADGACLDEVVLPATGLRIVDGKVNGMADGSGDGPA